MKLKPIFMFLIFYLFYTVFGTEKNNYEPEFCDII